MKLCAAVVPLLFSAASIVSAGPVNPHPHYRPKSETAKPRQALGIPAIVNAASYLPGISPGGLATIFGQNLSSVTGIVYAGTDPLPLRLADVSVNVNGIPAPLYGVALANGQNQISFQVPYDAPVGQGAALVEIINNGVSLVTVQTDSYTEDPGIFLYGENYAVAALPDYSLIGPNNPAFPGDTIVLYTTGLGPLDDPTLVDGYGAPLDRLVRTVDPFQVEVDGEQCFVAFSGLAPGFVGLYQINVVLPNDLPQGNLKIQIFSQYANSGVAVLPVQ